MFARKRAIGLLLVFLLLGAAANVGVAWSCALRGPPIANAVVQSQPGQITWPVQQRRANADYVQSWERLAESGLTEVQVLAVVMSGDYGMATHRVSFEARRLGTPFRCLEEWGEYQDIGDPRRSSASFEVRVKGRTLYLPTHILWPGFIANTLFYAATLAALWFIPRHLIARARRRHNRCGTPGCNYALDGLKPGTPCPECGKISARS